MYTQWLVCEHVKFRYEFAYLHHTYLHNNQRDRSNVLEPHSDHHSSSRQVGSIWLSHIDLRTTGDGKDKCCRYCSHHGDSQGHCMYLQARDLK